MFFFNNCCSCNCDCNAAGIANRAARAAACHAREAQACADCAEAAAASIHSNSCGRQQTASYSDYRSNRNDCGC